MTHAEFHAAIAEMLECEASEVSGDSVLKDLPNWDSLAILSLAALANTKFGVILSGKAIAGATNVKDLEDLLPGKLGS